VADLLQKQAAEIRLKLKSNSAEATWQILALKANSLI
jgi:hypothetical protein